MNKKQFEQTERAIALQKKLLKPRWATIIQAQVNHSEPLWNRVISSNAKINTFNCA
ncbi:hypothetical protein [Nostoc sp. 'Lobaria pulmonaria (5183) cyanobiont']|uniref:hypothetical protein n=1 Tax=Nostoc sp. 'Lobaria pulmonaria (5183) cyanobiont' TaxID=1618022 RepID=UPI00131A38FB|nr:hypothetical protein [Nostoc sp. 'Lobaria pulmonaria (5183) cyanobiont']